MQQKRTDPHDIQPADYPHTWDDTLPDTPPANHDAADADPPGPPPPPPPPPPTVPGPQIPAGAEEIDLRTVIDPAREILETDPIPPLPPNTGPPFWVVYSGLKTGCFNEWNLVAMYTHGVPRNRSRGFSTEEAMRDSWVIACTMGGVSGPLSEYSLYPFIVPNSEVTRRLQELLANTPAPGAAAPAAPQAAAPAAAAPAAAPAADAPAGAADDDDEPEPVAWVVIRGLHPGVQYSRQSYRIARGEHPDSWGFPAPTARRADRMWLDHLAYVRFLPF